MKKLDKLILKSYLGPLGLTFSISMFVLLLQFLWAKIVVLVGKGLDAFTIFKLLCYACATLVPMALPLSILLASIMTMGNFGERYELVSMKSAGISLWRILRPLIIVSFLLSIVAFYFSNNIMPDANMKVKLMVYEIKTKKPALNIRPNEFYYDINSYVIRIGAKAKDGKSLKNIIIYDHSKDQGNISVTKSDSGLMYSTDNGNTLIFRLFSGESFNESIEGGDYFKRPLTRIDFKEQVIRFDVSDFSIQKVDKDRYKTDFRVLNLSQLRTNMNALNNENKIFNQSIINNIFLNSNPFPKSKHNNNITYNFYNDYKNLSLENKQTVDKVSKLISNQNSSDYVYLQSKNKVDSELIRRHEIEFYRKFTLSAACFILFFIGAPLGAIIRKGGLGLPVVVSIIAFIIYYMIGTLGEMSARSGSISTLFGMWLSSLIFLPIGLFLTLKATSDAKMFSGEIWIRKINILFNKIKEITKSKK